MIKASSLTKHFDLLSCGQGRDSQLILPVKKSKRSMQGNFLLEIQSTCYILLLLSHFNICGLFNRGIKLQEDPAAVLVLLEEGAMQIDLPEAIWRKMRLNGETDSPKLRGSLFV